jgi:hypothetical protein
MAFPILAALTIGSSLLNLGGNLLSRPKRRRFDAAKIFPGIRQGILQNVEAVTSPIRQSAGQSAEARGLTGGAGAQVVAQAEAPVRAQAQSDLSSAWTQLKLQEEQSRYEDEMAQRQWRGQLFGDLAGAAGAVASGMVQQQYDDKLLGILSGGGQTAGQPAGGRLFGIKPPSLQSPQSRQAIGGGLKGGIYGKNGISFMQTPKRRRVANQYDPLQIFGLGQSEWVR